MMGKVIMSGIVPPLVKPSITLSKVAEGSIVKLNENGSLVDFYVACHNYEPILNGAGRTLLVRKNCYDKRSWRSNGGSEYSTSDIDSWLNSTYKSLLDEDVQNALGTTFQYTSWLSQDQSFKVGVELTRDVFLMSASELAGIFNGEGTLLPIADILKVNTRLDDGTSVPQWTRSTRRDAYGNVVYLTFYGNVDYFGSPSKYGSRPCFTLPAEKCYLQSDGSIILKGVK